MTKAYWCRAQGSTKEGAESGPASVLPVLSLSALLFYLGRPRGGVRKDFRINKGFNDACPKAFSKGGHTKSVQVEFKEAGGGGRGREALVDWMQRDRIPGWGRRAGLVGL